MGFKFLPAKVVQAERNTKQKLFFVSIPEAKLYFAIPSGFGQRLLTYCFQFTQSMSESGSIYKKNEK